MTPEESAAVLLEALANSIPRPLGDFLKETGLSEDAFREFCKQSVRGAGIAEEKLGPLNPAIRTATYIQVGYELARKLPPVK